MHPVPALQGGRQEELPLRPRVPPRALGLPPRLPPAVARERYGAVLGGAVGWGGAGQACVMGQIEMCVGGEVLSIGMGLLVYHTTGDVP